MLDTIFEKETCGRCGGCGRYSYNQMDGDRCYGCDGMGERLTKRGQQAAKWFRTQMEVPATELKPGDVVKYEIMIGVDQFVLAYLRFEGVNTETGTWSMARQPDGSLLKDRQMSEYKFTRLKNGEEYGVGFWPGEQPPKFRRRLEGDELKSLRSAALEYQSTLTKAGTPRKRAA